MKKLIFACLGLFCFGLIYYSYKRSISLPSVRFSPIRIEKPVQESLNFLVVGDTGSGDKHQYAVAEAMEKRCLEMEQLDGLLFLGDHFYMTGVESTEDEQWQDKFEKPYGSPCLSKLPIYPVFGNHDYRGNKDAFIEYSRINPRWQIPHRFYSVGFGKMLKIVAFDSNFVDLCFSPEHCSLDFLNSELAQDHTWKFVLAHHPIASSSVKGYSYGGKTPYGHILKHFTCNQFDAFFAGHAHHLEHRSLKDCSGELFISGSGGADLREVHQSDALSHFAEAQFGFMEVKVQEDRFHLTAWNKDLKLLYQTQKTKQKQLSKN